MARKLYYVFRNILEWDKCVIYISTLFKNVLNPVVLKRELLAYHFTKKMWAYFHPKWISYGADYTAVFTKNVFISPEFTTERVQ